jgi:hypothetical protein
MSMYVELLAAVLSDRPSGEMAGLSLLDEAVDCRARLIRSKKQAGVSAQQELAYELAYDSALVKLCAAGGIDVDPGWFSRPGQERTRLEQVLAGSGVDLTNAR